MTTVIAMCDSDAPDLRQALNSVTIWGGSGSILDVEFEGASIEAFDDTRMKNRLLRRLFYEMLEVQMASAQVGARLP